jgi:hypothetical protein
LAKPRLLLLATGSSWRNGLRCALANHVPRRWRWAQTRWRVFIPCSTGDCMLARTSPPCPVLSAAGCSPSVGCRTIFAATRNPSPTNLAETAPIRDLQLGGTVGKKATSWACVRRAGSARNRIPALSPDRLGTPELNQSAHHGDTDGYLSPHSAEAFTLSFLLPRAAGAPTLDSLPARNTCRPVVATQRNSN